MNYGIVDHIALHQQIILLVLCALCGLACSLVVGLSCRRYVNFPLWWVTDVIAALVVVCALASALPRYHAVYIPANESDPTVLNRILMMGLAVAWLVAALALFPKVWRLSIMGVLLWIAVCGSAGGFVIQSFRYRSAVQAQITKLHETKSWAESRGWRPATGPTGNVEHLSNLRGVTVDVLDVLQFRYVQVLDLQGPTLDDSSVHRLGELKYLSYIVLRNCDIDMKSAVAITSLKGLSAIEFWNCRMVGFKWSDIAAGVTSESLRFVDTIVSDDDVRSVANPHLKFLYLIHTGAGRDAIAAAASAPALKTLGVAEGDLDDAMIQQIRARRRSLEISVLKEYGLPMQ